MSHARKLGESATGDKWAMRITDHSSEESQQAERNGKLHSQKNSNTRKPLKSNQRYIYTMEFYAAERKKELIPFAMAWMELESIMISEISQAVRDKYHMISPLTGT